MFKGYIYKCTCVISGKSYVGLTTKTIEERKKEHLHSSYNPNDNTYKTHFHSAICNRRYKSTGKLNGKRLVFRYTHDKFTASDKKQLASNNKGFKSGKPVAGYSFDTGAELFRFDSVTKAAKALNLDSHSISSCASGKYKYSGKIDSVKIVWKYI